MKRAVETVDKMDAKSGRWILVQSKPTEEFDAKRDLERRGYEVFLPWIDKEIQPGRKAVRANRIVKRAYFPMYVFVFVPFGASMHSASKAMGVSHIVKCGETPMIVEDEIIERLKSFATPGGYIDVPQSQSTRRHGVKPGQVRAILQGPFAGYVGTVESVDRLGVVQIAIDIFRRSTLISVPVAGLGEQQIHHNGGAMPALLSPA